MTPHTQHAHPAAWVENDPLEISDVDAEIARLRSGPRAGLLPTEESPEGRQLRRWITQTLVARRLLEHEASRLGLDENKAPTVRDVLPDRLAAMGLGGTLANVLRQFPVARAVYAAVTADETVTNDEARAYLNRSGSRDQDGGLDEARQVLLQARKREAFLDWMASRTAVRVRLEHGYEHPGDPSQPDATHRH